MEGGEYGDFDIFKTVKLRRGKRNNTKGKRLQNKPKARRKNRRTTDKEPQILVEEEATIKRVTKLLGDVSVEILPDFEEDANVFQDLDLMILGSSPEEYMKYTELLRREYSYLDDANYKKMRLKVSQTASGSKRSTKKQRKILLNSKRVKKVANTSRKSILSRMNQLKLHKNKKMKVKKNSNYELNLTGYNYTEAENETNECIFVDSTQKVIVIDDDDINETAVHKTTTKAETDELIWINSQMSEHTSALHESNQPNTSTQSKSSQSKKQSPENSLIAQKDLSQSKVLSSTMEEGDFFYRDTTPALDAIKTPLYDLAQTDDSVIFVDSVETAKNESIIENIDDSVVFVSEEVILDGLQPNQGALDYIPLDNNNEVRGSPLKRKSTAVLDRVIQPFKKFKNQLSFFYQNTSTPKEKKSDALLTRSEKKQNQHYNSNVYNPHKEEKKTGKRMVIIDGSNVAFGHSLNKEFSVKGLEICIDYFVKKGHEVKAVVPQFRLQKFKSSHPERLEEMHKEGKIVFTPCKNLPGKSASSYDDRFILQLADEFDAAVVSNDNYRDLLGENPAFKKIVENRVIGYTWCKDMFLLPKDPYGRLGPTLSVILNH